MIQLQVFQNTGKRFYNPALQKVRILSWSLGNPYPQLNLFQNFHLLFESRLKVLLRTYLHHKQFHQVLKKSMQPGSVLNCDIKYLTVFVLMIQSNFPSPCFCIATIKATVTDITGPTNLTIV